MKIWNEYEPEKQVEVVQKTDRSKRRQYIVTKSPGDRFQQEEAAKRKRIDRERAKARAAKEARAKHRNK